MKTINWTTGSGHKIEVRVTAQFGVTAMGHERTDGCKEIDVSYSINGSEHESAWIKPITGHPVVVANLGKVGLTAETYALVDAAIATVEAEIAEHNAPYLANARDLAAFDRAGNEMRAQMS